MNEKKKKPLVRAITIKQNNPALDYVQPNILKVNTKIEPDNSCYMPLIQESGKYCNVFLNTVSKSSNKIILNHRSTEILDLGCKITISAGYKINGNITSDLSSLGLICSSVYLDNDNKLKFIVVNAGKQTPIILTEQDLIGKIWIEPVYYFDWDKL